MTAFKQNRITWDELAKMYNEAHPGSRPAFTLDMDTVLKWAERQKNLFFFDKEGYLCKKQKGGS